MEEALACLRDAATLARLRQLRAEGRVRMIGTSISSAEVLRAALDQVSPPPSLYLSIIPALSPPKYTHTAI